MGAHLLLVLQQAASPLVLSAHVPQARAGRPFGSGIKSPSLGAHCSGLGASKGSRYWRTTKLQVQAVLTDQNQQWDVQRAGRRGDPDQRQASLQAPPQFAELPLLEEGVNRREATAGEQQQQRREGPKRRSVQYSNQGMGMTDTLLESTNEHRLWVAAGLTSLAALAAKGALAVDSPETGVAALTAAAAAYLLADLGTGIFHWAVDNYGDASTPVFGQQIDAFQGHHQRPWTITQRQFANNLHRLFRPATFVTLPLLALPGHATVDSFLAVFMTCIVFSQQFHAWAHLTKDKIHPVVLALQEAGLLVSQRQHGLHHRSPFSNNYCIVSGIWNYPLDRSGFLVRLERLIADTWGVVPRCWGEAAGTADVLEVEVAEAALRR